MKKILFLLFLTNSLTAQNNLIDNLDLDYGFQFAKLEDNFLNVNSQLEFYQCPKCDRLESTASRKVTTKVKIGDVVMDGYCDMIFIDSALYKIELAYTSNGDEREKILAYLESKYGKQSVKPGGMRYWNTKKTHLEAFFQGDSDRGGWSTIKIYSQKLDKIYTNRMQAISDENAKNEQLIEDNDKDRRKGKGNGTLIPDITATTRIILNNTSRLSFEKLLPKFDANAEEFKDFEYNPKTGERDIFIGYIYNYEFNYKNDYKIVAFVYMNKNQIIHKVEYQFNSMVSFFSFEEQRVKNGYYMNESLSKIISVMSLNESKCYKRGQLLLTVHDNLRNFSISK